MTKKTILYFFSILVFVGFLGAVIFTLSSASASQKSTLWNLQKLEKVAENGDIEAQLRLINFYKKNINSRDHYKDKLEYWSQKAAAEISTDEYKIATQKLNEERTAYFKAQQERQREMKERMLQLKEKYEKLPPEAQKNEEMMWHDGIKAVFNPQAIYSWKTPFSLRYRLTINIETPEGIKTGTTVQEVFYPPADNENIYNRYNQGIPRGEAAYIDLGERGVVFAIMPDPANAKNRFFGLIRSIFPTVPTVYDQSRYQEVLQHYDELEGVRDEVPPYLYPMFVHFKDMSDPQSIELAYKRKTGSRNDMKQVEVNRFEELFGEGVRIKSIYLEMTDDPLEWKLDDKLAWLENMKEKEITKALREADPRIHITNGIAYYVFRQAQQDPLEKISAEKKAKQEISDRLSKATAYKNFKDIPWVLSRNLRHHVTLDNYLDRTNAEVKDALDNNTRYGKYKSVLELDMNNDGQITLVEANSAALNAFVTIDKNKDGKLSYGEVEDFRRDLKSAPSNK